MARQVAQGLRSLLPCLTPILAQQTALGANDNPPN